MKTIDAPRGAAWQAVERAVAAFEESDARGPDAVAAHLPPESDPIYLPVLRELVRADLEFAWSGGVPRRLEEYRGPLPALFADPDGLAEVAYEEYRQRLQAGDKPAAAEYASRYGVDISDWSDVEPSAAAGFPEAGELFLGFRILRELGRGAFAKVYLAEQAELAGRLVALKVSDRFADEPHTLARLQHTNIVPVHSTHSAGRLHAVCMPYFGCTTLADILKHTRGRSASGEGFASTVNQRRADSTLTAGPKPAGDAPAAAAQLEQLKGLSGGRAGLWVAAQLADGLAHAHDRGVLHRDVKPANVLIGDDGRPMLLDFNLSGGGAAAGGTPQYMAPEHLAAAAGGGTTVDARADIYSLGLILYETLTGRPPHEAPPGKIRERVRHLREARARPLRRRDLRVPPVTPAVAAVLARCLDPDPARRYASAHQLRDDLRAQLDDQTLRHAREPLGVERLRKFTRRNRWVRSLPFVTAALLVCLGVAGYGLWSAREGRLDAEAAATFRGVTGRLSDLRPRLTAPASALPPGDLDEAKAVLAELDLPGGGERFAAVMGRLGPDDRDRLRGEVADAMMAVGQFRALSRSYSEALEWSRRAGRLAEDDARRWLAGRQQAMLLDRLGRGRDARRLRDALGKPPAGAGSAFARFAELYRTRDYRDALGVLQEADPRTRRRWSYWYYKGRAHAGLGEWADAEAAFTTAMSHRDGDDPRLSRDRGLARLGRQRYAEAEADLSAAIRLLPAWHHNYVDRALARIGRRDYRGAVADLERAEPMWPGHTRILFLRARARRMAGDAAGASRDLRAGLALEPGDATSRVARGVARLRAKDIDGAIFDFDTAVRLDPACAEAMQNKAHVLAARRDGLAAAVKILDRLVAARPDYLPGRAGRAVLLARSGRRGEAHADAAEVLRRDDAPFTRYQMAGVFALTSRTHPADRAEALRLTASALRDGLDLRVVAGDPDIAAVRDDPTFVKVVQAARVLNAAAAGRMSSEN